MTAIGLLRGLTTFFQLCVLTRSPDGLHTWAIDVPVVEIEDEPAHSWRGLLLDVARHFITMDAVLALLPLCAAVKINVLHIHLTDDQGWRYESRQYPELNADASTGGKFYSHKEIQILVQTARRSCHHAYYSHTDLTRAYVCDPIHAF